MPTYILDTGQTFDLWADARIAEGAHDDAPLTLEQACWVPELCQPNEAMGRAPIWTAAALRGAIDRGDLAVERHGRLMYVTKRLVREWRDRCRTPPRSPDAPAQAGLPPSQGPSARPDAGTLTSGGAPDASTQTVSTARASGGSSIAASKSAALAAVMARTRNAKRSRP